MTQPFEPISSNTHETVNFFVEVDGKHVKARISAEALSENFGAGEDPEDWVNAYRANSAEIDAVAEKKIRRGDPEPVLVDIKDF